MRTWESAKQLTASKLVKAANNETCSPNLELDIAPPTNRKLLEHCLRPFSCTKIAREDAGRKPSDLEHCPPPPAGVGHGRAPE